MGNVLTATVLICGFHRYSQKDRLQKYFFKDFWQRIFFKRLENISVLICDYSFSVIKF